MSTRNHNGYYHATPERLRVHVNNLKSRQRTAKSLEILLLSQPGIKGVRASHITGNVLVKFDERITSHETVLQSLADLGHMPLVCGNTQDTTIADGSLCDLGISLGKNLAKVALKQALAGSPAAIILELL